MRRLLWGLLWVSLGVFSPPLLGAQTLWWDNPAYLIRSGAAFPQTVTSPTWAAVIWQESRSTNSWPQVYLSIAEKPKDATQWTMHRQVLGPFTVTGQQVQISSAVIDASGTLWLAVLARDKLIQVYKSSDQGSHFQLDHSFTTQGDLLAPKLFLDEQGHPLLFANLGQDSSFRIAFSSQARGWSPFQIITDDPEQRLNFLPDLLTQGTKLTLVYQALLANSRPTYQIYEKVSLDNGKTWSPAQRLSDFTEDQTLKPNDYDNQRPHVASFDGRTFVSWERRTRLNQAVIIVANYDAAGHRLDVQRLTSGDYTSGDPVLFSFQKQLYVTWHDNRRLSWQQYLSRWDPESGWTEGELLSNMAGDSYGGQPLALGKDIYILWQTDFDHLSGVVMLSPLRHVDPPVIFPANFKAGEILNRPRLTFTLQMPEDRSGIQGYNFTWDQNPLGVPLPKLVYQRGDSPLPFTPTKEGPWYLHVIVHDRAGNWSAPATVSVVLKTTPPGPVRILPPPLDENGWAVSNTFTMSWQPSTPDARYYAWKLLRLAGPHQTINPQTVQLPPPPSTPTTSSTQVSFHNLENGTYALMVEAFDEAGNRGQAYSYFLHLDKFKPYTKITYVDATTDNLGRVHLEIGGEGFSSEGSIDEIFLDHGGPPESYRLGPQDFHLVSDRLIDGIVLNYVAPGLYRVGVHHSRRGNLFTGLILKVEPSGVVKIGDYHHLNQEHWSFPGTIRLFFSVSTLPYWGTLLLLLVSLVVSGRFVFQYGREILVLDRQAAAIFTDRYYQRPSTRRLSVKRKGLSLRVKFTVSILVLTISVVGALSTTLGFFITQNSQLSLGEGLRQRAEVLLNGLAASARTYLPSGNNLELSFLPGQISAMQDAEYTTITGRSSQQKPGYSYVWASNDPNLSKKIDTPTLIPGVSVIHDGIEKSFLALQKELNKEADASVSALARRIDELNAKAQPYALRTDAESQRILAAYQSQIVRLEKQVNDRLAEISRKTESFPPFQPAHLFTAPTEYVFYKPIIYRTAGDNDYVKGLIRLAVTTKPILKQITEARDQLVFLTELIALVSLFLGLVGAIVLSTITVNPIKKLVKGVEKIRDTEDKAELAEHVIQIRTKDEIADLAETINQMTQGLVHAAEANKDLLLGKDIQKTFIPLDKNPAGRKMTTGYLDLPTIEKFGYYEGAKGVSGDYYGFQQLDNNDGMNAASPWYGYIKCDVSGKGIPAALIMFNVATLVVKFFRSWTAKKEGRNPTVHETVAEINDLLESLGYKGRFAALNMGLLNVQTGKIRFCHAGDNIVHVWRHQRHKFETLTFGQSPATGQIADFMARPLYKDYDIALDPGDTVFLYTDGIEEAKRYFRGANGELIAFRDPDDPSTKVSVTEPGCIDGEDLNPERIEAIVTAFYNRGTYTLVKRYDPWNASGVTFDFSSCDGSARQAVLALVAVEKIFRLVPDPTATKEDRIKVDIQIDEFLKKHFVEYSRFFHDPQPDPQFNEYVVFSYLKEDDQFDDLTLLAIRRKDKI